VSAEKITALLEKLLRCNNPVRRANLLRQLRRERELDRLLTLTTNEMMAEGIVEMKLDENGQEMYRLTKKGREQNLRRSKRKPD
jgi:hypothetical protein